MANENKLMLNPFISPCKEHKPFVFDLKCKDCIEIIKGAMFKKETSWAKKNTYEEVIDFMKRKGWAK